MMMMFTLNLNIKYKFQTVVKKKGKKMKSFVLFPFTFSVADNRNKILFMITRKNGTATLIHFMLLRTNKFNKFIACFFL